MKSPPGSNRPIDPFEMKRWMVDLSSAEKNSCLPNYGFGPATFRNTSRIRVTCDGSNSSSALAMCFKGDLCQRIQPASIDVVLNFGIPNTCVVLQEPLS